jgi:hypothetical protein
MTVRFRSPVNTGITLFQALNRAHLELVVRPVKA